jgi:hypothetical protein
MGLLTFLLEGCPPWEGFVRHWNLEELAEWCPALSHIPHQQPVSWYVRFHLALKRELQFYNKTRFALFFLSGTLIKEEP